MEAANKGGYHAKLSLTLLMFSTNCQQLPVARVRWLTPDEAMILQVVKPAFQSASLQASQQQVASPKPQTAQSSTLRGHLPYIELQSTSTIGWSQS